MRDKIKVNCAVTKANPGTSVASYDSVSKVGPRLKSPPLYYREKKPSLNLQHSSLSLSIHLCMILPLSQGIVVDRVVSLEAPFVSDAMENNNHAVIDHAMHSRCSRVQLLLSPFPSHDDRALDLDDLAVLMLVE